LVNSYLTDANGLPLIGSLPTDPADYLKNVDPNDVIGMTADGTPIPRNADDASFVPDTRNLDPRLDWTVGRKGIPFNGWGDFPGLAWTRDPANGGSYVGKKTVYQMDQQGTVNTSTGWAATVNSINTNIIRFSELLLWRAEVAADEGDLATAATYVDLVRARAANPAGWVKRDDGTDAATYVIGLYADNGGFADMEFAKEAILMEYRLETALEGHRFFDLVRLGKANEVLNAYLGKDQFRSYLDGVNFSDTKSVFPIPQNVIDLSRGVLKQNDGY